MYEHYFRSESEMSIYDLPSLMIYAKIQPPGVLGSGKEHF